MELSPTHSGEKSIPVNVLMSQWWISRAMKTVGQSDAKINTQRARARGYARWRRSSYAQA